MRKFLIIPCLAAIMFAACKKKANDVSTLVTYSVPTITVSGSQYYSINIGGSLPSVSATAYDSFYRESDPVIIDQSTLDNTTPGLYIVNITAKNKYGMKGSTGIYVAVTNISPAINLAGVYQRISNSQPVNLTRLANGLYVTDNVGGVNPPSSAIVPAYLVQVDDTTLSFPSQNTSQGTIVGVSPSVSMVIADTTFQYKINGGPFNPNVVRVFQKQ